MTLRYSGPRGKGFSGDTAKAASLQRTADLLVGSVIDRLKAPPFNGKGMLVDRRRMADGSWIHVLVNMIGMRPIVRTWIESPQYEETTRYENIVAPELYSGWFKIIYPLSPIQDGTVPRVFLRHAEGYGPWENSEFFVQGFENSTTSCPGSRAVFHGSVLYNRGSNYSGKMREVVQLLQGQPGTIHYNYQWCKTHGIYINPITGMWWVIEISAENGVLAWQLQIEREFTMEERDYFNITTPWLPKANVVLSPEMSRVLLDPVGVEGFYLGKTPYYSDMGWAFGYSGHEAQNLCWHWPGDHKIVQRWKITISSDEDGNPITAALTQEEEEYIYALNEYAPKFPVISVLGESLISFDVLYESMSNPPPTTNPFPIDVFFSEDQSEPHVVRLNAVWGSTDETEIPADEWPPPGAAMAFCGDTLFTVNRADDGSHRVSPETTSRTFAAHIEVSGASSPVTPEQNYYTTKSDVLEQQWVRDGDFFYKASNDPSFVRIFSEHYRLNGILIQGDFQYLVNSEIFVKPFFEREGFVLYHKLKEETQKGVATYYVAGAGGGTEYFPPITYNDTYVAQYAFPPCTGAYDEIAIGENLKALGFPLTKLSPYVEEEIPNSTPCEGGGMPMYRTFQTQSGYLEPSCFITKVVSPDGLEQLRGWEHVYLFTAKNGYEKIHDGGYVEFDSFTAFIQSPLLGAQIFIVERDVFSGGGVSNSYINNWLPEQLVLTGRVGATYPITESMPDLLTGWFGIP